MNGSKINSDELLEAIRSEDRGTLDKITGQLVGGMSLYLQNVYKVDAELSGEMAHAAFEKVYRKVFDGELSGHDNLFGYCITAAKNEYLMEKRSRDQLQTDGGDILNLIADPQEPSTLLLTEKRKEVLINCIQKLDPKSRKFIFRVLSNIRTEDRKLASELGYTLNNFRVFKTRLITRLHKCVRNELNEE